jgi:long-chain acyl-CoA synthetase
MADPVLRRTEVEHTSVMRGPVVHQPVVMGDHTNMTPPFEIVDGIASVFDRVLGTDPDREALVSRRGRWSYGQLDEACARAAGALAAYGVGPGDRVAAILGNEADIVMAFHGAMRLGAVWVGINQALAPPEQAFLLADSRARLLLCDADAIAALDTHRADLVDLRTAVDEAEWRDALVGTPAVRDLPLVDALAPAGLAYTSGTTGRPKGAVHSQHNLLVPGAVLASERGYGSDLRKGDCLPLTILNMMVLTTLLAAQAGGTTVIMDQMYAEGVADWIERERVTVWNGPPPVLHNLAALDAVAPTALASLREVWSGGADLPDALRIRFAEKFDLPIIGTYGLSEAPTVVSIDPPDGTHRSGASGQVLAHLDVRILADDGADVTPGEVGEICLAPRAGGPYAGWYHPPIGYWNRPEATSTLLTDDVVHTGDVGLVDAEGWLHIRDRKNLVILRGGANVYPAEVERVLDGIDGVRASAVTGVADERLGQRVVAVIEAEPGAELATDAILAHCSEQLARYKVPERLTFAVALPRNAMGKIDRTAVRQIAGDGAPG